MGFFDGHTHTDMSNIRMLDCTNKISKSIDRGIELGLKGIAITDHETVANHIKGLQHIQQRKREAEEILKTDPTNSKALITKDFKLGLGNEIYLCRDNLNAENYVKGEDRFYHFILIAKDKIGHKQIRELSSRAWNHVFRRPAFMERVPTYYMDIEDIVAPNPGHIIASTACLGGQLNDLLSKQDYRRAKAFVSWCQECFGKEDFYIELQPGQSQEQVDFNIAATALAKELGIRLTVTTDAHYLKEEDRPIHKSFLNSNDGDREVDEFYASTFFMSEKQVRERLAYLGEEVVDGIMETTTLIADKITEYDLAHKQIIPRIPLNWNLFKNYAFEYGDYPWIRKFFDSEYEEDIYFISFVFMRGLQYGILDDEHLKRIDQECEEMWIVSDKIEERLSAYFITVNKIIDLAWTKGDSLVGPWRGSVGSMLTAYLMDVTQRDPLKSPTALPYWRFCSRGRAELADIDIDSQASKRERFLAAVRDYFESIGGELTAVATFGTETSKAALQTACRGLEYEPELGTYLSSLVPSDRGFVRSLHQCYYGDEEKDYKPIPQFVKEMNEHPDIWEVAEGIEGLISHRGVHASGVILTNDAFTELSSTMRSPKGVICSQWELHDEEYAGHIKYDFLTIDGLDRIRTTMELLLQYGYMEWEGTLKDTYMKYLRPDVLDYDTPEMWKMVGDNKIISLFQFDTPVGLQAAKQIKPESLLELAQANSLMRLMPEAGHATPVEEFVVYKQEPWKLREDIEALNATDKEKEILYNFMKPYGGILDSQESLMLAVMIPEFTNYNVDEANKVRKVIAKKKIKEVAATREAYYQRGHEMGTSEDILKYIWEVQAARQMGYSFSIVHTIAYSTVAIQELNLAYHYPQIFWNTACLTVDSAGIEEDDEGYESDDGDEEEENDKAKKKVKTVRYGKISAAIGKIRQSGIVVTAPDINTSTFTFKPDVEKNQIVYGMKGISKINDDYARVIIANRPYDSLEDFMEKVSSTKLQIINLIKSGAFDNIEREDREVVLYNYIKSIANCKTRLTLQNMPGLISHDIIPEEFSDVKSIYMFNKYIKKNCKSNGYYILDDYNQNFFNQHFDMDDLEANENNEVCISVPKWERLYKKAMDVIRPFLKEPETLEKLNDALISEIWDKYCSGNISKWEMDSVGFYSAAHELDGVDFGEMEIANFFTLPEEPVAVKSFTTKDGKVISLYQLVHIAGTVLEKNKLKNIVTLLTQDGVVKVKIYKPQFVKYDKQAFVRDEETGKKKVTEKSWFTRGNKLILTGIRRDDNFIPKVYKNTPTNPIMLIDEIDYRTGEIHIKEHREE